MNARGAAAGPAATRPAAVLRRVPAMVYLGLGALACVAMVAAFVSVATSVVSRLVGANVPGLDAYAGYAIAAALFLALPMTFQHGDHIRVTLFLDKLPLRVRPWLELWSLAAGFGLALYFAVFAARLVWISHLTHDISTSADATPLWIPQIAMALGCAGFALSLADALWARLRGRTFFSGAGDDIARAE